VAGELDMRAALEPPATQSLLRQVTPVEQRALGKELRFRVLETCRAYGLEQLETAGELLTARRAHAAYLLDLAEEGQPHLPSGDKPAWLDRLELESMRTCAQRCAGPLSRAKRS
jgi:predicted ATPase